MKVSFAAALYLVSLQVATRAQNNDDFRAPRASDNAQEELKGQTGLRRLPPGGGGCGAAGTSCRSDGSCCSPLVCSSKQCGTAPVSSPTTPRPTGSPINEPTPPASCAAPLQSCNKASNPCCSGTCPNGNNVKCPAARPTSNPTAAPVPTASPVPNDSNKCGGAVNTSANSTIQCTQDLWNPTGDSSMHCFAYGGSGDPCSLNNNNDPSNGINKDPSLCKGDTFYLWDEPDTQGLSFAWAGSTWVNYATTWASQLQTMRQAGTKVTSPLITAGDHGVIANNIWSFFTACGAACTNPSSPAYINVIGLNVFCGPWNNGNCRAGVDFTVNELWYAEGITGITRPVYITNWSRLQSSDPEEQIVAINAIDSFFVAGSPVERVYWFGATDYGGGSTNNFLTTVAADGQTLGQKWRAKCDSL